MASLTSNDLRTVLDLVHAMHADERGAPPLDVLAELGQLVGADVSSYTRVEHRSARLVTSVVTPAEQNLSDREIAELVTPHWAQAMDRRARLASLTSATRRLARHADRFEDTLAGLPTLTRSERAVVEQLVGGLTDREIARCLGISPRTVHKHLEHVYRKLGATNRAGLIAILYRAGLAPRSAERTLTP
ncbi:MAG TPA: helix-turn-helix transcriptional regulator [Pseudonocardia sp.]|nr:helix-turn-helix transcriptional regulator [Pseudonocardia sp.]